MHSQCLHYFLLYSLLLFGNITTFRVGHFALDYAGVRLLNGSEDDFEHFIALFSATQTIVECVGDGGAVADDAPRVRAVLFDAPQD